MYKKILVPVALDHEENIASAISVARVLADSKAEITLLHVMEEVPSFIATQIPAGTFENNRKEVVAHLAGMAKNAGGGLKSEVVIGHASRTILEFAEQTGADCIVISSHRPGLQDYFLGSTAARVVRHATCAVHVIR